MYARTTRTPDPEPEKHPDGAELIRSFRWVEADIQEFLIRSGEYSPFYIPGLLHHLEVDDQTNLSRRCSDTLALLDRRITLDIIDTKGPYEGMYKREA